ncbi:MAG TPA: metallophosphoesterase [Stellaceae bacterium]|nr:metallophosphoesterase [Stellaceae bacterium]
MKVALIADTHLAERAAAFVGNWQAIRLWLETTTPDLIIHLGDITADGLHDPSEFQTAAAALRDVFQPLRVLPGNHDIGDVPAAGGPLVTDDRLAAYHAAFGADHWSCELGCWQLIGLNAQLLGHGGEAEAQQLAWFEAALASHDGPLGLMLHKPLLPAPDDSAAPRERYVPGPARDALLTLLGRRDCRFVVSGHTHQTHRFRRDGIDHVWVPPASFIIPDHLQEPVGRKLVGLMTLHLDEVGPCGKAGEPEEPGYRFDVVTPASVVCHDITDHLQIYSRSMDRVGGGEVS